MSSRSITGLVLAALLAAPAAAHAQSRPTGTWIGGLFGLEAGDESGVQFRLDGEVPVTRLSPNVSIAGVGTLSLALLSNDIKVFELVPSARINVAATPQVGAYGDVGLGLAIASGDVEGDDDTFTGATMRFLGGAYYEMNPSTRFVGEIGLHPHFGDYDPTTFTLMIGVKFRM